MIAASPHMADLAQGNRYGFPACFLNGRHAHDGILAEIRKRQKTVLAIPF